MIKDYTTTPLVEHDADYPWYRPGYLPSNTCDYPYHFPYFNSYPTYTVTTTTKCQDSHCHCHNEKHHDGHHHDKHHHGGESRTAHNILIVLAILIFVLLAAQFIRV